MAISIKLSNEGTNLCIGFPEAIEKEGDEAFIFYSIPAYNPLGADAVIITQAAQITSKEGLLASEMHFWEAIKSSFNTKYGIDDDGKKTYGTADRQLSQLKNRILPQVKLVQFTDGGWEEEMAMNLKHQGALDEQAENIIVAKIAFFLAIMPRIREELKKNGMITSHAYMDAIGYCKMRLEATTIETKE